MGLRKKELLMDLGHFQKIVVCASPKDDPLTALVRRSHSVNSVLLCTIVGFLNNNFAVVVVYVILYMIIILDIQICSN